MPKLSRFWKMHSRRGIRLPRVLILIALLVSPATTYLSGENATANFLSLIHGPMSGARLQPNPPGLFTQLSQWGHYLTGGYVVDPPNLSALDVTSTDDVDLLVTTPGGALTGVDPVTGSTYQEGGAYWASR